MPRHRDPRSPAVVHRTARAGLRARPGGHYAARCRPKKPNTLAQPSIAASGRYIGAW